MLTEKLLDAPKMSTDELFNFIGELCCAAGVGYSYDINAQKVALSVWEKGALKELFSGDPLFIVALLCAQINLAAAKHFNNALKEVASEAIQPQYCKLHNFQREIGYYSAEEVKELCDEMRETLSNINHYNYIAQNKPQYFLS